MLVFFFFSSRRRHTRFKCDWSSDVCSSDLHEGFTALARLQVGLRVGRKEGTQLAHRASHLGTADEQPVEHGAGMHRKPYIAAAPDRWQRRHQLVDSATLAVELANILSLCPSHLLDGQPRVVMEDAVMRLALAPRLPGRLVAFPKAVDRKSVV